MDHMFEKKTKQTASSESERLKESAEEHKAALKQFWSTFGVTGVLMIAILVFAFAIGFGWYVSNTQVNGSSISISMSGQNDFALATVGRKSQGIHDSIFRLADSLMTETIDGIKYYIAAANSSFRIDSDKNFNNYLANSELSPGNKGSFDLYVIRRSDKNSVVLQPVFSAWYETESVEQRYQDAFMEEDTDLRKAAEFLKGHILMFTNMDEKGMYSGNIDLTKPITVEFAGESAENPGPHPSQEGSKTLDGETSWGEKAGSEGNTEVYRLPVYWVWPEQFGNFIYTGNSYNKNLFVDQECEDYEYFISEMQADLSFKKFFCINGNPERPSIGTITSVEDYKEATKNYELYTNWYNAADEEIATRIAYVELGFEIKE